MDSIVPRASVPALPTPSQAATPIEAAREEQPIDIWRSRLTGPGFREIEMNAVTDEHAQGVAALCLELAAGHHADAARRVISMNANVRSHAMSLLKAEPPRDADQQAGLALCILDAGYPIALDDGLADAVTQIVQGRDDWEEAHWAGQAEKFRDQPPPDPAYRPPDYRGVPPKYQGKGLPHFHDDPKYSMQNLNGRLTPQGVAQEPSDGNLVCKELQKAADGTLVIDGEVISKKEFLALPLEQGTNVVPLDREQLARADDYEVATTFGVNFEHENFGALLRELCRDLPVGKERSFRVGFRKNDGHVMRVFLKREPANDKYPNGVIGVDVYEPSVTRNIIHMKFRPERIAELQFDQFDSKHTRTRSGVKVLNIRVPDRQLAAASAGKFVSPTHEVRVAGLSQALAIGDHHEVDRLLGELANEPPQDFTADEIADLEGGLAWAVKGCDHHGIALFMEGLGRLRMPSQQKAQIAMARGRGGKMSLGLTLQQGADRNAALTVLAFVEGLKALRLDPAQVVGIMMGNAVNPALLSLIPFGVAPTMDEWGRPLPHLMGPLLSALRELGLDETHIDQIVNPPNGELLPRMVTRQDQRAVRSFLSGLRHFRTPAELAAPGVLQVLRYGNVAHVDMILDEIASSRIALKPIVQSLIGPGSDAARPMRVLMETGDPNVLDALSHAIYHFARELNAEEKKALLNALEEAQGARGVFGVKNSDAMKKLKKAKPATYGRFNDAKNLLRR
jgi:hypothetical protein